jgi:hypothetical protein
MYGKSEIMDNSKAIVEIYSGTLWESEMIKSLLEDSNIESFIKNSVLNSYAYEPTSSGEVKVMIPGSDFEKAKEIVEQFNKNRNI